MKKNIHPKYNHDVTVTCSCGNKFQTGSTADAIVTELCSECHPFYTGQQKIVDMENRVAKFEDRQKKAATSFQSKKEKMARRKERVSTIEQKSTSSLTLKDMLSQIGK